MPRTAERTTSVNGLLRLLGGRWKRVSRAVPMRLGNRGVQNPSTRHCGSSAVTLQLHKRKPVMSGCD